jgi:hypothetical protein
MCGIFGTDICDCMVTISECNVYECYYNQLWHHHPDIESAYSSAPHCMLSTPSSEREANKVHEVKECSTAHLFVPAASLARLFASYLLQYLIHPKQKLTTCSRFFTNLLNTHTHTVCSKRRTWPDYAKPQAPAARAGGCRIGGVGVGMWVWV